jgi:hypothetical protein
MKSDLKPIEHRQVSNFDYDHMQYPTRGWTTRAHDQKTRMVAVQIKDIPPTYWVVYRHAWKADGSPPLLNQGGLNLQDIPTINTAGMAWIDANFNPYLTPIEGLGELCP